MFAHDFLWGRVQVKDFWSYSMRFLRIAIKNRLCPLWVPPWTGRKECEDRSVKLLSHKSGIGQILLFVVLPLVNISIRNVSGYTLGCRTKHVNIQLCVFETCTDWDARFIKSLSSTFPARFITQIRLWRFCNRALLHNNRDFPDSLYSVRTFRRT